MKIIPPDPNIQISKLKWYAVHTRSRHEQTVYDRLMCKSIHTFLPKIETWSKRKDREKRIQVPMFRGYVFIQANLENRLWLSVLQTPGVARIISSNGEPVPIPEKILILHYLLTARGDTLTRNLITFRQVPEGPFYYSAFLKRARDPLVRAFGGQPESLITCGAHLGAEPDELGDVSITLKALPRVPVTMVLWAGDDEFPPEASLLFDESIVGYLPTEDIAVLSGMIVYRLIRLQQRIS